jgi:small-conductance mechanosensitive channel
MEIPKIQILESAIILLIYVTAYFTIKNIINSRLKDVQLQRARRKIIIKILHILTTIISAIFLAGVWGFSQNQIFAFVGSVLTVLGIALFAQWSLLSNITSSVILFINHPLKLGDTIQILDKDYPIEGEVTELTYFFVHIRTEKGEIITIPNSLFLQKSISLKK